MLTKTDFQVLRGADLREFRATAYNAVAEKADENRFKRIVGWPAIAAELGVTVKAARLLASPTRPFRLPTLYDLDERVTYVRRCDLERWYADNDVAWPR